MNWRTPGYMIREEMQRNKLRGRAARRAWNFEKRLEEGKGGELARKCLEEVRRREGREGRTSEWEKERIEFIIGRGVEIGKWNEGVREEMPEYDIILEKDIEVQKEERRIRIEESKYNRWYKRIRGKGIPEYLRKGWAEVRWRRIARFRLGCEMGESRYWEEEEKNKCRVCGNEEETWEHVWEECWGGERQERG